MLVVASVFPKHFNTSHVNVNPFRGKHSVLNILDFNTSHVNVNRNEFTANSVRRGHFNTSHVNVNLHRIFLHMFDLLISIHLMLMLICKVIGNSCIFPWYFNTSHVNVNPFCFIRIHYVFNISIHLMLMLICCRCSHSSHIFIFQYISC